MTENKSSKTPAVKGKQKLSPLEEKLLSYAQKGQPVLLYGKDTHGREDLIKKIHLLNGGIDAEWEYQGDEKNINSLEDIYDARIKALEEQDTEKAEGFLLDCKDTNKTWRCVDCNFKSGKEVFDTICTSGEFKLFRFGGCGLRFSKEREIGRLHNQFISLESFLDCYGLVFVDNLKCTRYDSEDERWYLRLAQAIESRRARDRASGSWLVAYAHDYTTFPEYFKEQFKAIPLSSKGEEKGIEGFRGGIPTNDYEFILNGEYWRITYKGKTINLKDSKGLQYIHYLLEESGNEFYSLELMRGGNKISVPKDENTFGNTDEEQQKGQSMEEGLSVGNTEGFAEEILDEETIKQYRERLYELKSEREDDTLSSVEIAEIDEETAGIAKALRVGLDKRGQSRKVSNPAERARKSVLKAINESLDKIKDKENGIPALWKHFDNTLTKGISCSYKPENPILWDL